MLDLDDFNELQTFDQAGLLVRAGQVDQRWPAAQRALANLAATTDLAHCAATAVGLPLVLVVPPELMGIGRTVHALLPPKAAFHLVQWEVDVNLSPLYTPGLLISAVPTITLQSITPDIAAVSLIDLSQFVSADQHPVQVLLFLLALLERLNPTLTAPLNLPQMQQPMLANCIPDVPVATNPAKQLALQIFERLPFFWATGALVGVADDWRLRLLWYAECMAWSASTAELVRLQAMARLPRYWFNIVTFVHLTNVHLTKVTVHSLTPLEAKLDRLLTIRRLRSVRVSTPADSEAVGAVWHLLELGEWLALYTAALYNVEPTERVPLQFLGDDS